SRAVVAALHVEPLRDAGLRGSHAARHLARLRQGIFVRPADSPLDPGTHRRALPLAADARQAPGDPQRADDFRAGLVRADLALQARRDRARPQVMTIDYRLPTID